MKKVKKMIMDLIAQGMEEEIAKIEASLVKFEKDREEQHEVYKTAAKHLEDTIYAAAQAVDVMKPAKREVDRVQLTPTVRRALAYAEMFAPERQLGHLWPCRLATYGRGDEHDLAHDDALHGVLPRVGGQD